MSNDRKITADMLIFDVIEKYPETADIFKKHFHGGCFACPASRMETLSDGADVHGLNIDDILEELNAVAG